MKALIVVAIFVALAFVAAGGLYQTGKSCRSYDGAERLACLL